MKYNIILAYVLAASSFSIGCIGAWEMMDKGRGRETQLAPCHQDLSQYSVININISPHHPWGRFVHLSRLIDEGFHNTGNLKIKLRRCIRGFCLASSAPITCCLSGRKTGIFLPWSLLPSKGKSILDWTLHSNTPYGHVNFCGLYFKNRVHGLGATESVLSPIKGNVYFLRIGNDFSPWSQPNFSHLPFPPMNESTPKTQSPVVFSWYFPLPKMFMVSPIKILPAFQSPVLMLSSAQSLTFTPRQDSHTPYLFPLVDPICFYNC